MDKKEIANQIDDLVEELCDIDNILDDLKMNKKEIANQIDDLVEELCDIGNKLLELANRLEENE